MNKIKQNKITFILILISIIVTFSSLTILSLPVLFNYKSKVDIIEKNFYKKFKIQLNSSGDISYKPFPKPHLLVEKAALNFREINPKTNLIETKDLRIFISLRELYLRSFKNLISTEISNTNLNLKLNDIIEFRKHLYEKINNPIVFNDCKLFIRNKKDEVILISPLKKVFYKINNETKIKIFNIDGEIFGINFKSNWKRNYNFPNMSSHDLNFINPKIEITNLFFFEEQHNFKGSTFIKYSQDKLKYDYKYNKGKVLVTSPNEKGINFKINGNLQLSPFNFDIKLNIDNKKVHHLIDNILLNLLQYEEKYLGNLDGTFKIIFTDLNNRLIKNGEINFDIKEKKINLKNSFFNIDKIGKLNTKISFLDKQDEIIFFSKNKLIINDHIEFAKTFQIGSNKVKNIRQIYFDLEKNIGSEVVTISNIRINTSDNTKNLGKVFIVKNIQNLRAFLRQIIN